MGYYGRVIHKRFISLLRSKYPDCVLANASAHGAYSNTRNKAAVGIVFQAGGKVYEYTGSYTDILERLGIVREWAAMYSYDGTRPAEEYMAFYSEAEAVAFCETERAKNAAAIKVAVERGDWVPPRHVWSVRCKVGAV